MTGGKVQEASWRTTANQHLVTKQKLLSLVEIEPKLPKPLPISLLTYTGICWWEMKLRNILLLGIPDLKHGLKMEMGEKIVYVPGAQQKKLENSKLNYFVRQFKQQTLLKIFTKFKYHGTTVNILGEPPDTWYALPIDHRVLLEN